MNITLVVIDTEEEAEALCRKATLSNMIWKTRNTIENDYAKILFRDKNVINSAIRGTHINSLVNLSSLELIHDPPTGMVVSKTEIE